MLHCEIFIISSNKVCFTLSQDCHQCRLLNWDEWIKKKNFLLSISFKKDFLTFIGSSGLQIYLPEDKDDERKDQNSDQDADDDDPNWDPS